MTHDIDRHDDDRDDALQARLRGLRRDQAPGRDLWPDIAAAIAAPPGAAVQLAPTAPPLALHPRHHQRRSRRRSWLAWSAAASLALAVALGWSLRPQAPGAALDAAAPLASAAPAVAPVAGHVPPAAAPYLLRQADAMAREYAGALREVEAIHGAPGADSAVAGALTELDHSAAEIRAALAQTPDSRFLVERLQRVYAQRLALTLRVA